MKNPAPYIREQIIALLNGTINYDSVNVPCYEGQGEVTPYQILIGETSYNDRFQVRDAFTGQWEQVIEVVSEQETNLRKHVDAIGSQVMNLVKPTPRTAGIDNSADYVIGAVRKVSQNYLDEQSGEGTYINRLILRFSFIITQI